MGATVIQVSTEFVFDGNEDVLSGGPFDEWSAPLARSIYARSKLAGERLVAAATPNHHIVRLQNLYGAGGHNFLSRLRPRLAAGEIVEVDRERLICPMWAGTAARYLCDIAESGCVGVWHVSVSDSATHEEFARQFPGSAGVVGAAHLRFDVHRPSIRMDCRRLEMLEMTPLPTWKESLKEYLVSICSEKAA